MGQAEQVEIELDPEYQTYDVKISILLKGATAQYVFNKAFFEGSDYTALGSLSEELLDMLQEGAFVQRGDKTEAVDHFVDAFAWLLKEARRGVDIQRYKGLGEMNPDQLWETTMDPNVRRMLRVTVEDAIGADQMFTTLMGDQVEPRRAFIETNALSVVNLDV